MKIDRLINWMKENSFDALLLSSVYNIRYFSGFTGDTAYLYVSAGRFVLMTDSRYTTWAKSECEGVEVFEIDSEHTVGKMAASYLRDDGGVTVGFEDRSLLYCDVMKLKKEMGDFELAPVGGGIDAFRMVKTAEELKRIKAAESIGDAAFSHMLEFIHEGQTEMEAALELEMFMRTHGAERLSFETITASGENSAMPHSVPGKRAFQNGDFVIMDFGCVYEGYCSDMTRTVVIGHASERQREIYNTVLRAQKSALAEICAGKKCSDIDKAARDIIKEAGYGEYFGHGLGHGVGLFIHEEPRLSPKNNTVLLENMTETVEPGIYIPGFGGVRIEDLVVVEKEGYENFTSSSKELIEL